ncbi:MAG: hypothetical protein NTY81_03920 [Candidatus Staskawiczbacteria bacterium]|nr:hypothetical protein [Candidatus Staskawiczbacteria bacterium]
MRGKSYSAGDKEKVKRLILSGKSYNEITKILGTPKSTISVWFGKTLKKPVSRRAMLNHLKEARKIAVTKLKIKWDKIRNDENKLISEIVEKELPTYPLDNIGFYKAMLSMLYWAEGAKRKGMSGMKLANSDPKLIKLFIALMRKCYNIDERKFKVGLYLHYYHSIKKVKNFWSDLLGIPLSQFHKVYIKKRSKTKRYRKNFVGVCFLYYSDNKIRKELLELGNQLQMYFSK